MPAAGSSVQPCRRASSIACRRAPPPARRRPERSIAAWCARPMNSRYGRPIRRASATPCSRCRSASAKPPPQYLGDAEVDQRQRAQLLAQAQAAPRPGPRLGPQPLRLFGRRRKVAALPGEQQPDHAEQHVQLAAPAGRAPTPIPVPRAPGTAPLASSDPAASSSAAASAASSASAAGPRPGTRPAAHARSRPARPAAGRASGRRAGGRPAPSPAPPGHAGPPPPDTRARRTTGGHPVQRGNLARRGAAQLQLQQVGEQLVVAEPGPRRVQRRRRTRSPPPVPARSARRPRLRSAGRRARR